MKFSGSRVISESTRKSIKALPAPQLAELRDRGYLEWMYFQMASLAHVSGLVARKNRRLSGATQANRSGTGDAAQG